MFWDELNKKLQKSQELNILGPMPFAFEFFQENLITIVLDGGANHGVKISEAYWVGDGDSLEVSDQTIVDRDQLNPVKNYSDLAYVLSNLKSSKLQKIYAHGLLEGRVDHQLSNFGETINFLKKWPKVQLFNYIHSRYEVMCLNSGEHHLTIEGVFSLFSLEESKVTLTGSCEYQLPEMRVLFPLSSLGLSNKGHGDIKLTSEKPLILISHRDLS